MHKLGITQGFTIYYSAEIPISTGSDPQVAGSYREQERFVAPQMTQPRSDVAAFEYEEVGPKIPNYLAGDKWGVQGEVKTQMQKPLSPDESLKHYVTPENFHLELFVCSHSCKASPLR